MLILDRPLYVIDTETTGVSVEQDRIIEIAVLRIIPDTEPLRHLWLINPTIPIPPDATAVHGITDADVAKCDTFKAIAPYLHQILHEQDLAGYNLRKFDVPILQAEFARVGLTFTPGHLLDAYRISVQREPRDLAAAVKFFCGPETTFDGHRAMGDTLAAWAVLQAQLERYEDLPRTVPELHEFCENRDPSWIDAEGKFAWRNGEPCINFGKNAGRRLRDLAKTDPSFLRWMVNRDFTEEAKQIARDALRGTFPTRATTEAA